MLFCVPRNISRQKLGSGRHRYPVSNFRKEVAASSLEVAYRPNPYVDRKQLQGQAPERQSARLRPRASRRLFLRGALEAEFGIAPRPVRFHLDCLAVEFPLVRDDRVAD